jgi:hypothetical protein
MLENIVEIGRSQMTIWRMRIACWIHNFTNAHSEYVILTVFPLQQWLKERAFDRNVWLPITGIWYGALWQKCVTANHRDLVLCTVTEMCGCQSQGFGTVHCDRNVWLPVTGIWYGALWQKYDSQSQGFATVHSDRNVTANHGTYVTCNLTEIWEFIMEICFFILGF